MYNKDSIDQEAEREGTALKNANRNPCPRLRAFINRHVGTRHIKARNDRMQDLWEYLLNRDAENYVAERLDNL